MNSNSNSSYDRSNGANPPCFRIPLRTASKLVGVPYDSLISANRSGRLKLVNEKQALYNQSLFVELFDLVTYMVERAPKQYRWFPEKILLTGIVAVRENQPRQRQDNDLIGKIADDLRMGASVSPVWVIKEALGNLVLIDGFHRLEAHAQAQLTTIWAVEILLPSEFINLAIIGCNRKHGRNLTSGDLKGYVMDHLRRFPDILAEITNGTRVQAELAGDLGVSPATLTRAVQELGESSKLSPLSPRELLLELRSLYGHLDQPGGDESPLVAYIFCKALASVVSGYSGELKAHIKKQIKLKSSVAVRSLDSDIYRLLDRRGGDRRRKSDL
jgi:hypothetical protein